MNPHESTVRKLASGEPQPAEPGLIETLNDLGLAFNTKDGNLVLADPLELLDADLIRASLSPETSFDLRWSVGSTNTEVLSRAPFDIPVICIAERQVSGKGRRGRHWVSPFGRNLYMSFGFSFPGKMPELAGLSMAVGLEVVAALADLGVETGIKWPNDVLTPDGKLCGILVELGAASRGRVPVVAGIGINVHGVVEGQEKIEQPWTSVARYAQVSRNQLAANFMQRMERVAGSFHVSGLAPYIDRWSDTCVHAGERIRILRGEQVIEGIDRGIDGQGNLRLEVGGDILHIEAGEVSLRRTNV